MASNVMNGLILSGGFSKPQVNGLEVQQGDPNTFRNMSFPDYPQQTKAATTTPPPAPTVDPWAGTPWGSKTNYDKAVADYQGTKNLAYTSINDLITNSGQKFKSSILDFVDDFGVAQGEINDMAVQNEMKKESGRRSILDMVGTGLRSGGVTLNNANATNSSAGEQIARAYNEIGRSEMTKVGNQYALGQNAVSKSQKALGSKTDTFMRHLGENKTTIINGIVSETQNKLAALDSAAINASLPDRISIENEKARIRDQAMRELSQYDSLLTDGLNKNKPKAQAEIRGEAYGLLNAGTAPEDMFNYTTSIPSQFQGSGPWASPLPIFTQGG